MAKATRVAKAGISPDDEIELNDQEQSQQDKQKAAPTEAEYFEEWRCEIKIEKDASGKNRRRIEKVKRLRPKVKISEEYADVLNAGALDSPRTDYVIAYFRPE